MNTVYLSLGSNRGNKEENLQSALQLLEEKAGKLVKASSVYETAPWQMNDATSFLNQVVCFETELSSLALMEVILKVEEVMGRVRTNNAGYEPRTIDIDILFFNSDILESDLLTVPHKFIAERRFVLQPLNDIAPDYVHPTLKKSMALLLTECPDKLYVQKFVTK